MKKILLSLLTVLMLVGCNTDNKKTTIKETVILEDLTVGEKYELIAYLTFSGSDEVYVDADGKEVKVTKEFTARKSRIEKEVKLVFNGSNAIEKKLKLYYEIKEIGDTE